MINRNSILPKNYKVYFSIFLIGSLIMLGIFYAVRLYTQHIDSTGNPEHLEMLKLGGNTWNKWRQENPEVRPNFSGLEIKGMKIAGANLSNSFFGHTSITGSEFTSCDFSHTSWSNAQIKMSSFRKSSFHLAHFGDSRIEEVDFQMAALRDTEFWGGQLHKLNFANADLSGTGFLYLSWLKADFSNANCEGLLLRGSFPRELTGECRR